MPSRRAFITGALGLTATGGLLAMGSESARGSVSIAGLEVPDNETTVANGVEDARLSVSGDYSITMAEPPTRVILRLEVTHNDVTSQVDATEPGDYQAEMSGDYLLEGSILDHPEIDSEMLYPENRGESKSLDLTVTVKLQIKHNGSMVGTANAEDTTTLTTTRQELSVETQIGGDGSTRVITATPAP